MVEVQVETFLKNANECKNQTFKAELKGKADLSVVWLYDVIPSTLTFLPELFGF